MIKDIINQKKKENKKKQQKLVAKNLVTGAGLGIIAGAIGGILLAPKSGKETRQAISDGAKELNDTTKRKTLNAKNSLTKKSQEAKCKISEYLNEKRQHSNKEINNDICNHTETIDEENNSNIE